VEKEAVKGIRLIGPSVIATTRGNLRKGNRGGMLGGGGFWESEG